MSVFPRRMPAALVVLGLLALTPAASARPSRGGIVESLLGRLWPGYVSWKAGCSLDPGGRCAQTKEGCSLDPDGRCIQEGCSLDPSGRCIPTKNGCSLDPSGQCQPK